MANPIVLTPSCGPAPAAAPFDDVALGREFPSLPLVPLGPPLTTIRLYPPRGASRLTGNPSLLPVRYPNLDRAVEGRSPSRPYALSAPLRPL